MGYEFTFKKKVLITGLMTNTINQETQKKHQLAVKYLTGMTLIIKTKLLQKAKKELERIKQESLDKMKN